MEEKRRASRQGGGMKETIPVVKEAPGNNGTQTPSLQDNQHTLQGVESKQKNYQRFSAVDQTGKIQALGCGNEIRETERLTKTMAVKPKGNF